MACHSFRTQGVQRPQKTQTYIFVMTMDKARANSDIMTGRMFVFSTPARVLFYSRSSSFVSSSFALHVDRELSSLKNKLVVMGE